MATGHFVGRTPRTKEKLLTHGTVGLVLATFAIVIGIQFPVDTHSTIMTMLKIFGSSYTTKATVGTVIRLFIIGHPEITNITMIFPKLNTTTDTIVPTDEKRQQQQNKCEETEPNPKQLHLSTVTRRTFWHFVWCSILDISPL
jgi:hypothetical protein